MGWRILETAPRRMRALPNFHPLIGVCPGVRVNCLNLLPHGLLETHRQSHWLRSDPCGSSSERLNSGYDTQECIISGAGWNDPGHDPAGGGIHRRRIRRCARSDSGDEIADIFYLCLCWSEYCGVSVRLSQSAVLSAAAATRAIRSPRGEKTPTSCNCGTLDGLEA